jgi:hypothetical protein
MKTVYLSNFLTPAIALAMANAMAPVTIICDADGINYLISNANQKLIKIVDEMED